MHAKVRACDQERNKHLGQKLLEDVGTIQEETPLFGSEREFFCNQSRSQTKVCESVNTQTTNFSNDAESGKKRGVVREDEGRSGKERELGLHRLEEMRKRRLEQNTKVDQ